MRVLVTMKDVNGAVIDGRARATFTDRVSGRAVDVEIPPSGGLELDPRPAQLILSGSAPEFVEESAQIAAVGGEWLSSNPACVAREREGALHVDWTLGVVRFAPVVHIPEDARVRVEDPPAGVLLEPFEQVSRCLARVGPPQSRARGGRARALRGVGLPRIRIFRRSGTAISRRGVGTEKARRRPAGGGGIFFAEHATTGLPVQPYEQWGVFLGQAGVFRLVKEVTRFLFARGLVATLQGPIGGLLIRPGEVSVFPPRPMPSRQTVPPDVSIALSGFSAGIGAVLSVSQNERSRGYSQPLLEASPAAFMKSWVELWEVDGYWGHLGSREAIIGTLLRWSRGHERRRLRVYKTTGRFPGPVRVENGLVDVGRVRSQVGSAGFAEEGHSADGRITWVRFSNEYLEGAPADPAEKEAVPAFGTFDAHHLVPAIAFGHAGRFPPP